MTPNAIQICGQKPPEVAMEVVANKGSLKVANRWVGTFEVN